MCSYCSLHPVRLPQSEFDRLHFVPLPLMNAAKDHYKKLEELFGMLPSEVDRPSLASSPVLSEAKEADRENKKLLIAAKVRDVIVCIDCKKPRCVYASVALSCDERKHLKHAIHSGVYTCGCQLFQPGSSLHDAVICRQALTCKETMETQYYSSVCVSFPPVCWFCGCPEMLTDDEFLQNLRTEYIVRPICFLCRSEGKHPATWGACNVAAKRSKSKYL